METFSAITTTFGDDSLSECQVYRWHKAFLENRDEISDEARAERPSMITTHITHVRELLNSDRRLNVRSVAHTLNIPKSTVL